MPSTPDRPSHGSRPRGTARTLLAALVFPVVLAPSERAQLRGRPACAASATCVRGGQSGGAIRPGDGWLVVAARRLAASALGFGAAAPARASAATSAAVTPSVPAPLARPASRQGAQPAPRPPRRS